MSESTDWRQKYRATIVELEAQTSVWKRVDDVLRRLVKRLCIAARGINPVFDGELERLSAGLRGSDSAAALEALLERLTAAVAALDAVRADARPAARAPEPAPAPAPAPAAEPAPAPEGLPSALDGLAEPLLVLADRLGLGDTEGVEASSLRSALAEPTAGERFESAVWQLGDLVAAQRRRLEREKSETEQVLKQVTSRLGEFASFLAALDADRDETDRSGRELNEGLLDEVQGIGATVRLATRLDSLQDVVSARLTTIDTRLRTFRAREEERARGYHERAERMRERVVQLESATATLEKSLEREQRLALQDALTGIANRLAYDERIAHEFKRWKRFRQPLSLVAWDLDRFKSLNDRFGHLAGDRVLRQFASLLRSKVRETDFVARYGGEEFVMLLVGTRAADALIVAESIRAQMGRLGLHFRGTPVSVTASCGIAEARADDSAELLFDRADKALYRAKEAGRDCCVVD